MAPDADDALLAQLRRGTLQFCVLALLAGEPRYAFDVVRDLGEVEGMVTSEGTIYPLLAGCAATGSCRRPGASRPRDRRALLRADGRRAAALGHFTDQWRMFSGAVDHLLAGRATT